MKEWSILNLLQDKKLWEGAENDWKKFSIEQKYLTSLSTIDGFDKNLEWLKNMIVKLLKNHAKITRVFPFFLIFFHILFNVYIQSFNCEKASKNSGMKS